MGKKPSLADGDKALRSKQLLRNDASEGAEFTDKPASSKAAILSSPRPDVPLMMAPAWPMRFPGGAVRPAMNPNTGFG